MYDNEDKCKLDTMIIESINSIPKELLELYNLTDKLSELRSVKTNLLYNIKSVKSEINKIETRICDLNIKLNKK